MVKEKKPKSSLFRIFKSIKGYNHFLVIRALCALVDKAAFVFIGIIMIPMVNGVIGRDLSVFSQYAIVMVVLGLSLIPISALATYCGGRYGFSIARVLRERLGLKATKLPIARLDEMHSGDTVSRLNNDLGQVRDYISGQMHEALGLVVGGVGALIIMLIIEWRITLAIFLVGLPFMYLAQRVAAPLTKLTKSRNEELAKVNEVTQDAVSGYVEIKTYNLNKRISQRFKKAVVGSVDYGVKMAKVTALSQFVGLICRLVPILALTGLGGYFVIKGYGGMTLGSMMALIQLSNLPFQLLQALGDRVIGSYNKAKGASDRLCEFLDEKEERDDGECFDVSNVEDIINIKNVTFTYEDNVPILNNISLDIRRGEKVALVGESGCGKSTLLKIIAGFYDINKGVMQFAGHDLADWKLSGMRHHMALVDQDTYLYPVSLGENIACGNVGGDAIATKEDIECAAKRAHVHHFIDALEEGYDTMAGERGVKLSGGQRQRIAMARAVLKDADVLLLDEPTSALDMESERAVQQQLDEIMMGKTAVIVAHRLSTIQDADCIYVLDQGQIIESGNHATLMEKKGKYYQLVSRQLNKASEVA